MRNKFFLFGVGCQRGGTSWFHAQLCKHPAVDMGFVKEYHVFDSLYLDSCKVFLDHKLERLHRLITSNRLLASDKHLLRHVDFYRDAANYFDYFSYLFCKSPGTTVVGDITPSYCGLPPEAFHYIKRQLDTRGIRAKVVFLMRDPLERCWSQLRLERRNLFRQNPYAHLRKEADDLLRVFKSERYAFRTRYEVTIANLATAFSPDDIFFGFYEDLFNWRTIRELERFLGISGLDADFAQKVNASPEKALQLTDEASCTIVEFYRDTYLFCDKKFGVSRLWNGFRWLSNPGLSIPRPGFGIDRGPLRDDPAGISPHAQYELTSGIARRTSKKRILFVWEVGRGYGHIASLLPVALKLRNRGHDVIFALKDLTHANGLLGKHRLDFLQAPIHPSTHEHSTNALSYPEILAHIGYNSTNFLLTTVKEWRALYTHTRPDLLIFDHSPTALLAARDLGIPRALLGTGFYSPPKIYPMPSLRPWLRVPQERLAHIEDGILGIVNSVLSHFQIFPLARLADLFSVEEDFLCTFAELDHYQKRDAATYWGPCFTSDEGEETEWPPGDGPKLFVYLYASYHGLQHLVDQLRSSPYRVLLHIGGVPGSAVEQYQAKNIKLSLAPSKLSWACEQCDLAIIHGGHGMTSSMLLAGRPLLLLPLHLEQFLVSRNVASRRAGLLLHAAYSKLNFLQGINQLLSDPTFGNSAQVIAARYSEFDPDQQHHAIAERCEKLLCSEVPEPSLSYAVDHTVRRRAILVLGMHRSGTSALARVINLLGADLPDNLLAPTSDNEPGYWESRDVIRLNEALLSAANTAWHDTAPIPEDWFISQAAQELHTRGIALLHNIFEMTSLVVLKDPRFCRVLPFWRSLLKEVGVVVHYVMTLRHPEEVAQSLQARTGSEQWRQYGIAGPERSYRLWLRYVLDAERHTRYQARAIVTYDALITDKSAIANKIANDTGIVFPRPIADARPSIDQFISSQYKRQIANHSSSVPGSEQAVVVYKLFTASVEGGAGLDYAGLDAMRLALDRNKAGHQ